MSFNGIAIFEKNLRKLMDSPAYKNADEGQRLFLGGVLMRSKYGLGSFGGFGAVHSLPDEDSSPKAL